MSLILRYKGSFAQCRLALRPATRKLDQTRNAMFPSDMFGNN
ncbi:hypothetical protein [Nereida sp. MMG025]|nr:hypothetical protein [Nereida sp. MMG025]